MLLQLLLGLALSALIGILGYWYGALAPGGVLGAIIIGTAIFGFAGIAAGALLVGFFISSSALSRFRARAKAPRAEKFQKGARRDLGQALANGGWGAILAIALGVSQSPIFWGAFVGALATVTADTWGTEIGVLSKNPPRLITTGRVVPVGTSGGVTLVGTVTALAGGVFIGSLISLIQLLLIGEFIFLRSGLQVAIVPYFVPTSLDSIILWPILAGVSGLAGSLFDSLLGATVQAIYFCDYDRTETERRVHSCGRATRLVRGWRWLDNDAVNFFASVFGSAVAALLWIWR